MTLSRMFRPGLTGGIGSYPRTRTAVPRGSVLAAALLIAALTAGGQDLTATEYQLKAAYLTEFGRFVEQWSSRPQPAPDETFDICVLGEDLMGAALDAAVRAEKIGGAALAAKRIARPQDALGCRVLFISPSEENQLGAILNTLGTAPVLTVADTPDFVKLGGMIQFVPDGNHVRFEINLAASRHAGLALSSELLKLARVVRRTP